MVDQAAAHRVARVDDALQDLKTVIRQSRAATAGERIPDRMVSVADPDARPIKKGKLGKPVQFGYKVQIMEVESGFVTDYSVHTGRRGTGTRLGSPSSPPTAAMNSAHNQKECHDRDMGSVAIPKTGQEIGGPHHRGTNEPLRFAGLSVGEPTISRLKRKYGLRRSRYRGYDVVATGIGLGIFAHNVHRLAQRQASYGPKSTRRLPSPWHTSWAHFRSSIQVDFFSRIYLWLTETLTTVGTLPRTLPRTLRRQQRRGLDCRREIKGR